MKRMNWRVMGYLALVLLLAHAPVWAGHALSLGSGEGLEGQIPLSMSSDDPVEGIRVAVQFDPALIQVTHIDRENNIRDNLGAELVETEIFADGFILSFDMPLAGPAISAGNTEICKIDVRSVGCQPATLEFVDDQVGQPTIRNMILIAGASIGVGEGLQLTGGAWTPVCETQRLRIDSVELPAGTMKGVARVFAENTVPIEGFVLSIAHPQSTATLTDIHLTGTKTEEVGAEFAHENLYANGGTLGVILDFEAPWDGQTIPATGQPQHLANFEYQYSGPQLVAPQCATANLTFADMQFGEPKLENLLVQNEVSVTATDPANPLQLVDGSITFCEGEREVTFWVNVDEVPISEGDCAEIGYFYTSAADPIQGVSISSRYDARLEVTGINLQGSVTAAVNAEFVTHHAENGELIIGILVEAGEGEVPFDRMFPASSDPQLLCRIQFCDSQEQLTCGEELPVTFEDGLTGQGSVPINNRAAIKHQSVSPRLVAGTIKVMGAKVFLRGDCNFDGEVDIADPPSILNHTFSGVFHPPCLDACDANDDGMIDLADSVKVLRWLFKFGSEPPSPGPWTPGTDPTPDLFNTDLGCEAGGGCN